MHGKDAMWGLTEHLLAAAVDALHVANWQRSADGQKGRNYPEPIERPGIRQPERIGSDPVSLDEIDDWLGWKGRD